MLVTTVKKSMTTTWQGRPLSELSKDELIAAVEWCGETILKLREINDQLHNRNDPARQYFGDRPVQLL